MKKNIILIICLLLAIISCKKFLNILPENKIPAEGLDYSNTAAMYGVVSGVYAKTVSDPGLGFWAMAGFLNIRSIDVDKGSTPNDQVELQELKNFNYPFFISYWANNNSWEGVYSIVNAANTALDALNEYRKYCNTQELVDLNNNYQAEIRVLRSLAWFYMVRLYGVAVFYTDNLKSGSTQPMLAKDAYLYLLNELNAVIPVLPEKRPNEIIPNTGAVTAYTAHHLKAKIFSDLAGSDNGNAYWDSIINTTNIIINSNKFELYTDYYNLFKIPGKLCNESLYEMQYTDFGAGSGNVVSPGAWFQFQGPRGGMTGGQGHNQGVSFGCWGFMVPSQAYVDFLVARQDTFRYRTTVISLVDNQDVVGKYGVTNYGDTMRSGDGIKYTNGKFYTPSQQITVGRTDYSLGNNIRVLRYADVLLLNAEAKVRKGQNGDAPFNMVHERAKLSPKTGVTLEQILDERRAEFMGEWGEFFFDAVRTGQALSLIPKYTEDKRYYPLPQKQIDINSTLSQYAYPFVPPAP